MPSLDALPLGAHRLSALTDRALFEACGVRVAFAGRAGGTSAGPYAGLNCASHVGDDADDVRKNRRELIGSLTEADVALVRLTQVHGTRIQEVSSQAQAKACMKRASADGRDGPEADAVLVRAARVAALINTADCLPLVVVSPSGGFVMAHAGWRGTLSHIAAKAAAALAEGDPFGPDAFNAYIGPHIRSECFEVGADVAERFAGEFGPGTAGGARQVSLAAAVIADLRKAGLAAARIADCGICTSCRDDAYFSYRASGGTCGRNATVALACG